MAEQPKPRPALATTPTGINGGGSLIRRRPVSFGNPALGTYQGYVYTVQQLQHPLPVVEQATSVDRTVAMVDVPPDQVPEGMFNLIRPHRPWIRHLRIVIAEKEEDAGEVMEETKEEHNTASPPFIVQKVERQYLVLFEMESEDAAEQMVEYLRGQPYTSMDETNLCSIHHVVALQGQDGVSLQSPFFASTANTQSSEITKELSSSKNNSNHSRPQLPTTPTLAEKERAPSPLSSNHDNNSNHQSSGAHPPADGDYNCPVCLEHLHHTTTNTTPGTSVATPSSSVLTTVCNHSFHMDCLLQWQDSPCPVCRYDHSGLSETLSQCHVCGTTENNYVCLICGAISCGRPSGGMAALPSSSPGLASNDCAQNQNTQQQPHRECTVSPSFSDANSAIMPSSPPTGLSSLSHARQHYDETLHAYALDTETQHVWDFAGQGYVHRLLQNKDDGKLVEVSDPTAHSEERTQNPGLSETQETQVVHQKLEGLASSYYTLLKSQLEQQRIYYEGRLEEIRHEIQPQQPQRACDVIRALKQERHQLSQRLVLLQSRRNKVKDDVTFLSDMIESLESNKASFRRDVAAAQQERASVRLMFQECLPPLQEKVTRLMLQLEAESAAAASTSGEKKKAAARRSKK